MLKMLSQNTRWYLIDGFRTLWYGLFVGILLILSGCGSSQNYPAKASYQSGDLAERWRQGNANLYPQDNDSQYQPPKFPIRSPYVQPYQGGYPYVAPPPAQYGGFDAYRYAPNTHNNYYYNSGNYPNYDTNADNPTTQPSYSTNDDDEYYYPLFFD